eukprot:TRINITY_DN4582_c0_g1_i1.p1 TRINITY_DN4582_c0_g1~~TRINITY_DN4582_c0_g1_i1.p1  ORF type:complete len:607 (-),score=157.70 TRINITY_DN4582_c0_g1_i1:343-1935(-)
MSAATEMPVTQSKESITNAYGKLCDRLREIDRLNGVQAVLGWDEQVMMPSGAAKARSMQKSALAGAVFEKRTAAALGALLNEFRQADTTDVLGAEKAAVVRDAIRDFDHEMRKSKDMAAREAELEGRAYHAWVKARKENDWPAFAPLLSEMVDLKTEVAAATRPEMGVYDANIDVFERGMSRERLAEVFTELKAGLTPLLSAILDKIKADGDSLGDSSGALSPSPAWEVKKQEALCRQIAEKLGFNLDHGRLDVSPHPFTSGFHPTDVRITTRYSENWIEGIAGTVHEVGHALYEQGRRGGTGDDDFDGLPISKALSMGVHESQSLLWERMVFLGRPFWKFATPLFHEHFPHTAECTSEDFYRAVNKVSPGLIRVNADEVTYPMHIILRFELEQALFSGDLKVADVPAWWNKAMKDTLGVEVPSDAQGCLQDVHHAAGAFGYFPSYTLGAIMACQFYEAAKRAIPDLEDKIASGDFKPLKEWLNQNIHSIGSLYDSPDKLLEVVTGERLDPMALVRHLTRKYSELYKLQL